MPRLKLVWVYATAEGVPRRAFWVGVIVGTLLNAINQGGALVGDGKVDWVKLGLTYVVPYFVATYGAVSARMAAERLTAQVDRP